MWVNKGHITFHVDFMEFMWLINSSDKGLKYLFDFNFLAWLVTSTTAKIIDKTVFMVKLWKEKENFTLKLICDIIIHVYQLLQIETYSELSELPNDSLRYWLYIFFTTKKRVYHYQGGGFKTITFWQTKESEGRHLISGILRNAK